MLCRSVVNTALRAVIAGVRIPTGASGVLWGPPGFLFSGYRGSLPGVKRPVRESDHSPPSSTDVKNECSCNSTLPVYIHVVDGKNFTFSCTGAL
jgi:hypothetical protein